MDLLAVWLGKLTLVALRLIGRRGNALPGLVVEKVFPRFLPRAMNRLAHGVVVVSGTNGKTTTTKMVATILAERYGVAPDLRAVFPNDEELYGGPVFVSSEHAVAELIRLPSGATPRTTMRIGASEHAVLLRADGPHNAQNATGAAALALSFGFDADAV